MSTEVFPVSRKNDLVMQELRGEVLVYDLKINKAFRLNEISALVWQECDGTKSALDIGRIVSTKLNSNVTEDLIWLALSELKRENFLSNGNKLSVKFKGLSRRDVIKKVGFASMVALPLISSIVAPTSAQAASAAQLNCNHAGSAQDPTPRGCPCSLNTFCAGGSVCNLALNPPTCI